MSGSAPTSGVDRCLRYAARAIAVLWAIWWTFFVWMTVASEGFSTAGLAVALCLSLLFLSSAALAWRRERLASLILLVEGMMVLIGYAQVAQGLPTSTIVLVIVTLALPPLLAALFLTMCRR